MPKVPPSTFSCYSRNDSEFASRLATDLKAGGVAVWIDTQDIAGGDTWATEIERAISNSPRMLVLLSPSAASSKQVLAEYTFALQSDKRVIPVLYKECEIPLQLRAINVVDFRTDYALGLKQLLRELSPLKVWDTAKSGRLTFSASNAADDPTQSLQTFTLKDLEQFTKEKVYSKTASQDVHAFYVGRDDVNNVLKYVLSRVRVSLFLNIFGFDDEELNDILMQKALDPNVTMLITLDKSQSGSRTEKVLIARDQQMTLAAFGTHFVTGQSATHQISHARGFVADGKVAGEGSLNWSYSGEGVFVISRATGGSGYQAQNNTQSIITDQDMITRFTAELISEHMAAQLLAVNDPAKLSSLKRRVSGPGTPPPASTTPVTIPAKKTPAKKRATKS